MERIHQLFNHRSYPWNKGDHSFLSNATRSTAQSSPQAKVSRPPNKFSSGLHCSPTPPGSNTVGSVTNNASTVMKREAQVIEYKASYGSGTPLPIFNVLWSEMKTMAVPIDGVGNAAALGDVNGDDWARVSFSLNKIFLELCDQNHPFGCCQNVGYATVYSRSMCRQLRCICKSLPPQCNLFIRFQGSAGTMQCLHRPLVKLPPPPVQRVLHDTCILNKDIYGRSNTFENVPLLVAVVARNR
eukprot:GFKZ01005678.1.p1 GENE.GFKZ01005678.1~~GFKZ01005678.1.p1  ORF type:complete len:242 (+),score=4.40 GFKZ01005678.1:85-810(+)